MEINFIAVIVASVLVMVLGAIWYGPLFGAQWMRVIGISAKDKKAREKMQKEAGPLYLIQFLLTLLQVAILSLFVQSFELSGAIVVSFLIWLGFVIPTLAGSAMWTNDSREIQQTRFLIQSGYQLVAFVIYALTIALL